MQQDKSGFIDAGELEILMLALGRKPTPEIIEDGIAKIDLNGKLPDRSSKHTDRRPAALIPVLLTISVSLRHHLLTTQTTAGDGQLNFDEFVKWYTGESPMDDVPESEEKR